MTRPELIREWRADLLHFAVLVLNIAAVAVVAVIVMAIFDGWLRRRRHRLHRRAKHIGKGDSR